MTYDCGGECRKQNDGRKTLALQSSGWTKLILTALMLCIALGSIPSARAQSEEHSSRRVIHSQKPDYPTVLKMLGIGGTVRLNAKVLANGSVADVQILGGNPILAESAAKAVKTWKYAAAAAPSTEALTIEFNPK